MKRLLLLLLLLIAAPAYAASLPCTVSIDANGNAAVSCAGTAVTQPPTTISCAPPLLWNGTACVLQPSPPPPVAVVPGWTGTCPATPSNVRMQTMRIGGTNNYVFDGDAGSTGPQNTIQVFQIPAAWPGGEPATHALIQMASYIVYTQGQKMEIAFSPCPGDFSYYQSNEAAVRYPGSLELFRPCGSDPTNMGPDQQLAWGQELRIDQCGVGPGWYFNWRVVPGTCPGQGGHTCGGTFYVPRG